MLVRKRRVRALDGTVRPSPAAIDRVEDVCSIARTSLDCGGSPASLLANDQLQDAGAYSASRVASTDLF